MDPFVARIARYPVKALSAEEVEAARLRPGQPLPGDRRFALALAGPGLAGADSFVTLGRHPRLATLETRFDEATGVLSISRRGRQVVAGDLTSPAGRSVVSEFFAAFLGRDSFGHPRVIEAGEGFADHARPLLWLVGAGTLSELERVAGRAIGLAGLRAGVLVGGVRPWEELGWVGAYLRMGEARLKAREVMVRRTPLADPATGEVDTIVPLGLEAAFGHRCLGILAEVVEGGLVRVGDPITVEG